MFERVFIIGPNKNWESTLKEKGYDVISSDMDDFSKNYAINAVPQLTILDAEKNILYSGGYSNKRSPANANNEESLIIDELKMKHSANERPIFGCITGSINRKKTDPLNLKY